MTADEARALTFEAMRRRKGKTWSDDFEHTGASSPRILGATCTASAPPQRPSAATGTADTDLWK